MQEVIGSIPLSSTFHKPLPNRDLRYLTTFVSAEKTLLQSWKFFHEMNWNPAHGTKSERFLHIYSTSKVDKAESESKVGIICSACTAWMNPESDPQDRPGEDGGTRLDSRHNRRRDESYPANLQISFGQ